jgi:hypothetical protein
VELLKALIKFTKPKNRKLGPPEKLVRDSPKAAKMGIAINNKKPKRLGKIKTATTGQDVRCRFRILAPKGKYSLCGTNRIIWSVPPL